MPRRATEGRTGRSGRTVLATAVLAALAILAVTALPTTPSGAQTGPTTSTTLPAPILDPSCVDRPVAIHNGGFEGPVVADGRAEAVESTTVQGWTSDQRRLTLAASGSDGVTAATGRQFLELVGSTSNAHQDLLTTPGQSLAWALAHRAVVGSGTVRVRIGAPGDEGELVGTFTDGEVWTQHSGTYTVPAEQTITRLTFESDRDATTANLIDDASFGSPSCLVATATVVPDGAVEVGTAITESVVVRNLGGTPTTDATLATTLPATMAYIPDSARPAGVWNFVPDTLLLRLVGATGVPGVVLPGEAVTATWLVDVKPEAADSTIRSEVALNATDALGGPRRTVSNTAATVVRPSADVKLSQAFSPALVAPGATTTLTITANNVGPSTATGVTVAANLPPGSALAGPVPTGCRSVGLALTCVVGSMTKDDVRTWSIPLTAPATTGVVRSFVTTSSTTSDPSFVNGATSEALSVGPPAGAQLDVVINRSPVLARAGAIATLVADITNVGSAPITAPITITNATPEPFVDLFLLATPPAGAPAATCSTEARGCTLDGLGAGQSARVEFRGAITSDTDDGTALTGSITASSPGLGPVTAETTISVRALAQLTLTETSPSIPDVATPITSIVTVTNAGPSMARSSSVFIPIPDRATVVARPAGCTPAYGGLACPLGDIEPGRPVATTFTFSLPRTGAVLTDRAVAATTTPMDGPVTDLLPQRWVAEPAIDLSTSITGLPRTATTGDVLDLVVTATNGGPGDATDVVVALDTARNGLRIVDGSSASGDLDPSTERWTIPSLRANTTASLQLQVVVGRPGDLALAASAAARQPDVDSAGTTSIGRTRSDGEEIVEPTARRSNAWMLVGLATIVVAVAIGVTIVVRRRRRIGKHAA